MQQEQYEVAPERGWVIVRSYVELSNVTIPRIPIRVFYGVADARFPTPSIVLFAEFLDIGDVSNGLSLRIELKQRTFPNFSRRLNLVSLAEVLVYTPPANRTLFPVPAPALAAQLIADKTPANVALLHVPVSASPTQVPVPVPASAAQVSMPAPVPVSAAARAPAMPAK